MGGQTKKIISVVKLGTKGRLCLTNEIRAILKVKIGDYLGFSRQDDGILLQKIERFVASMPETVSGTKLRGMNPSHVEILTLLKNESLTGEEIAEKANITYDGVRGRISELRNTFGFNIILDERTKKYKWKNY